MAEENKAPETGAEEAKTPEEAGGTDGFKPIESQEAFDALIKDRIERAQNKIRKEYEGFESYKTKAEEYDSKLSEYTKQIGDLTAERDQLKGEISKRETAAEKSRIAREYGLPEGFANRLTGEKKEDWEADAKVLAEYFQPKKPSYPEPNPAETVNKDTDLLRIARELG